MVAPVLKEELEVVLLQTLVLVAKTLIMVEEMVALEEMVATDKMDKMGLQLAYILMAQVQ